MHTYLIHNFFSVLNIDSKIKKLHKSIVGFKTYYTIYYTIL